MIDNRSIGLTPILKICQNILSKRLKEIVVSKVANNIGWGFVGLALILGGFMLYVQGYKPIIFGVGILVILYRAVTAHNDEYELKKY